MNSEGNLRYLKPEEKPEPDEILVPAKALPQVQSMTRQQRRTYREQVKLQMKEAKR